MTEPKVIICPVQKFELFQEKYNKLQRIASKLNVKNLHYTTVRKVVKIYSEIEKKQIDVDCYQITLHNANPHYEDWNLIGLIDHKNLNLIRMVPGFSLPSEYKDFKPYCQHCNITRDRNNTFIVKNTKTHEYKKIGSSCLKSFLGGHYNISESSLFSYLKLIDVFHNEIFGGTGGLHSSYSLETAIAIAMSIINTDGYVSRKNSDDNNVSTGDRILALMSSSNDNREIISKYKDDAEKCISFMKENLKSKNNDLSDFEYNILQILEHNYVPSFKYMGVVAYIPVLYYRLTRDVVQKKNEFIGEVGSKISVTAKLVNKKTIDSAYGTSHIITFETSDGNTMVWFSTKYIDYPINTELKVTATVKDHKVFNNIKQTIITRAKLA